MGQKKTAGLVVGELTGPDDRIAMMGKKRTASLVVDELTGPDDRIAIMGQKKKKETASLVVGELTGPDDKTAIIRKMMSDSQQTGWLLVSERKNTRRRLNHINKQADRLATWLATTFLLSACSPK